MTKSFLEVVLSVKKESAGKSNLIKHLKGKRLTQRQAILAKCCDCMGYYVDGRNDCEMPECPLYPFMPYQADKKKAKILSGNASHERKTTPISPDDSYMPPQTSGLKKLSKKRVYREENNSD